jgi:hypothetical protein
MNMNRLDSGGDMDYEDMLRKRMARKSYEDYMVSEARGQVPTKSDMGISAEPKKVMESMYGAKYLGTPPEKPDLRRIISESKERTDFNTYASNLRRQGLKGAPEYNKVMSQAYKSKPTVTAQEYYRDY